MVQNLVNLFLFVFFFIFMLLCISSWTDFGRSNILQETLFSYFQSDFNLYEKGQDNHKNVEFLIWTPSLNLERLTHHQFLISSVPFWARIFVMINVPLIFPSVSVSFSFFLCLPEIKSLQFFSHIDLFIFSSFIFERLSLKSWLEKRWKIHQENILDRDLVKLLNFLFKKKVSVQHSVICIDITIKVVLNIYLSLSGS